MLKPGFKTTEFATTVVLNVAAFIAAIQGSLSPKWDAIAATVSVGLYAVGRGLAKSGTAGGTAAPVTVTTPAATPVSAATPVKSV